jgi:hypothetical protein
VLRPLLLAVVTAAAVPTLALSAGAPNPALVGKSVLLAPRTQSTDCTLGANPDRQCSPGAFYSKLTKPVICGKSFRTATVRFVPQSVKSAVERAYGLPARAYGSTLEIDHIVSLELGGSNEIANLYPERALAHPGYHVKDVLENKLHALVCAGSMTLASARRGIATNWQALYEKVFGKPAAG